MPHLSTFRIGWENENLARYILHKFSFLSHPATVADDIGSDYFCTLFQKLVKEGNKYLVPKNTFAIQIKSNKKSIDFSNKIGYLIELEIPFFVGVIDNNDLSLTIYSGEYLPFVFSLVGLPEQLIIQLYDGDGLHKLNDVFEKEGENNIKIKFPKLTRIYAAEKFDSMKSKVDVISDKIDHIYGNIISKNKQEYVFRENVGGEDFLAIVAGPGSQEVYRENIVERLAEAFENLRWGIINSITEGAQDEFYAYETLYFNLKNLFSYSELFHDYIDSTYRQTKAIIENLNKD